MNDGSFHSGIAGLEEHHAATNAQRRYEATEWAIPWVSSEKSAPVVDTVILTASAASRAVRWVSLRKGCALPPAGAQDALSGSLVPLERAAGRGFVWGMLMLEAGGVVAHQPRFAGLWCGGLEGRLSIVGSRHLPDTTTA